MLFVLKCCHHLSHHAPPFSHPDTVKLGVNETMEMVEAKFVEITKAYKA